MVTRSAHERWCSRHEPLHYHRGCECTVASSSKIAEHGLRFLRLRPTAVCFRGGVLPNSDRSAIVVGKRKLKIPVLWRSSLQSTHATPRKKPPWQARFAPASKILQIRTT